MLKPGDLVRVKNKETGEKIRAQVTEIRIDSEPMGAPSNMVAGPVITTITLVVVP